MFHCPFKLHTQIVYAIGIQKSMQTCSVRFVKKAVGVERRREGVWGGDTPPTGRGLRRTLCPFPEIFFLFFHFKIVHSGAFSYTNSKVLFAIKWERYVIAVFVATDGDAYMKTSSFHQSRKLIPIQSVATRVGFTAIGMCYRGPEISLHECKRKLHCRATVGLWCVAVSSLGWVTPGAATEGVTPLFFPENLMTFLYFLVPSSAVSPLISSSQKLTTFFCSSLYRFLLLLLGCHPPRWCHRTPFLPVRPRFSTILLNLPTGCHPGRSAPVPSSP